MSIPSQRPTAIIGQLAEDISCRYLRERGYHILERNFRRPWGELDIVASKVGVIHIVEVKGERIRSDGFEAYRRADARKLAKVTRTARTWLAYKRKSEVPWQIDVLSVTLDTEHDQAHIIHFKNVLM